MSETQYYKTVQLTPMMVDALVTAVTDRISTLEGRLRFFDDEKLKDSYGQLRAEMQSDLECARNARTALLDAPVQAVAGLKS